MSSALQLEAVPAAPGSGAPTLPGTEGFQLEAASAQTAAAPVDPGPPPQGFAWGSKQPGWCSGGWGFGGDRGKGLI